MSEESEFWAAHKEERQRKRAANRESGAAVLERHGIAYEAKNGDAHLIVRHAGTVIDYWPGTGLWIERGSTTRRRGIKSLLRGLGVV